METRASVAHLQLADGSGWRAVEEVLALSGHGLEGDKHARANHARQVLLVEREVLEKFSLPLGALHEQITTTGVSLASLPAGSRLRIGEALLELTGPCAPCSWVNQFGGSMIELLRGRRGVLARVIEAGRIRRGDQIRMACASI